MVFYFTGLSGSGKSYLCHKLVKKHNDTLELIMLDQFTCVLMNYDKYYEKLESPKMKEYVDSNIQIINGEKDLWWDRDEAGLHDDFLTWLLKQEGNYLVEGIQLYNGVISKRFLVGQKIYVLNTSLWRCFWNRTIRSIQWSKNLVEFCHHFKDNAMIRKYHFKNAKMLRTFMQDNKNEIQFVSVNGKQMLQIKLSGYLDNN